MTRIGRLCITQKRAKSGWWMRRTRQAVDVHIASLCLVSRRPNLRLYRLTIGAWCWYLGWLK